MIFALLKNYVHNKSIKEYMSHMHWEKHNKSFKIVPGWDGLKDIPQRDKNGLGYVLPIELFLCNMKLSINYI